MKLIIGFILLLTSTASSAITLIDLYSYNYTPGSGAIERWLPYTSNYSIVWRSDRYDLTWDTPRGQSINCITCIATVNGSRSILDWNGKSTLSFAKTVPFTLLIQNDLTPRPVPTVPELPVTMMVLVGILLTNKIYTV